MLKRISILVVICFAAFGAAAQTEKYTAPVKWERYKVSDKNVSILFPKLPTLTETSNVCADEATKKYAAYTDGIVYGLNIGFKSKRYIPFRCENKKKFDEKNFEQRLAEIKSQLKTDKETKFNQDGREVIKISGGLFTYWLVNDYENKRWFEIWVTEEAETSPAIKNFVESFKSEKNPAGIEIKSGSEITFGDETTDGSTAVEPKEAAADSDKDVTDNLRIILKPRARYTDAARQEQVQGTISLRVTFSYNGGVEKITVVKALPHGITQEAVAAARKIVFVPAKKDGKAYSVTKVVEYSFSIY